MHTTLSRLALVVIAASTAATSLAAQQQPVSGVTNGTSAIQRAETLLQRDQRDSATTILSQHVAEQPTDGRAWFFLGRIYLANVRQWHRSGHPADDAGGAVFVDMAGSSFEPAQELLTDSGGVYRVMVAMERATLRVEQGSWAGIAGWRPAADELPLPSVLAELGRNLLASCPSNGVLVTSSSVAEEAAVWGIRLQGIRGDLIIVRPDMYGWDARYRGRMAAALGVDSAADLSAALVAAAKSRPICLAPGVDAVVAPELTWSRSWLVLTTASVVVPASEFSVFRLSRTGVTGSVWSMATRDEYDLAARRNHLLCSTLFATTYSAAPPAIPACSP